MGNQINKLTSRQKRAIAALISCKDKREAAEVAGVGYTSINRWLKENDLFIAELRRAEAEIINAVVRLKTSDLPRNDEFMRLVREEKRAAYNVRLRAASLIDQSLIKWREAVNVEERLEALEKKVKNGQR